MMRLADKITIRRQAAPSRELATTSAPCSSILARTPAIVSCHIDAASDEKALPWRRRAPAFIRP
jgi:hypothetical protein